MNDYNESINDKPDSNPNAYYSRGFLKYNNFNDINGACLDWSKAGEQGRTSAYDLINKYCN